MKKSFKTLALMIFVILSAAFIAVSTSAAPLPGDVNGDGEVNIRDAATILQFVTGHDVELVAPCTHSGYVVIDPAVDPTYDKSGLTIGVSCTKCGEKLIEQETVPALGHEHTEAVLPAVPATCQEEGLTEGKYCPECNTVLVKQKSTPKVDHELGDWEAYGSYTVRRCIKSEDCDVSIRVTSISATYNGSRLLTGEQVWKNDVTVTITLSDNTSFTAKSSQFTLENDVMTVDGNNVVTVKFVNTVTTVTVPAIHDNLPGTAPASDFEYSGVDKDAITITKYIGTSTEVVIPAHINRVPVRYIGDSAFSGNKVIQSVTIPGSIKTIGQSAFYNCTGLKTLNLNEGLNTIKGQAFMNCPISTLVIPDSVNAIDCYHYKVNTTSEAHHGAFEGCTYLTEVIIGDGLTTIRQDTFRGCISLKDLVIGDGVETIELYAFENCSSLETLNLGIAVQSIGNQAFRNCIMLREINFTDSVKFIGEYAFERCSSLVSVNIPGSVQTISWGAFLDCSGLKNLKLNEGLITIQGRAFMNCPITSVVIPDSVLTIECLHLNVNTTKEAHHGAFEGCQFLTEVIIGNGLKTISRETFKDCSSLKTLVIGDSVTIIELYAFENCSSLEILNIGSSVQSIGNQAFRNCTTLSEINFSSSVKTIGDYSFEKCSSLASVSIPGNVQTIGNGAFWGCSGLKSVNLNEGLITIQGRAFMNCPITKIVIPNSVLTINCLDLNLNTTNEAHHGAFEGCNSLTKLVIGNGLTKISRETFAGCSALTDITIGSSVQTISDYAFSNCTALQTINIPDNVINIGPSAFKGCTLLENFRLGTGVQSIGASALQDCTSIDTVTIPANVQVIGNNAFTGCVELDETVIEKGALQSIGSNVYSGCSSFDRIYYTGNASDWSRISVNSKNVYPLTVTPYYYTAKEPSAEGNYWYYNSNGEKRVWNVGLTSFKAEEYSETFAGSAFGSETSSYASQLLKELKKDTLFQAELKIWEGVNLLSDFETRSISQKDLYKLLIYDLLMGEANSSANPYDVCAEYCDSFFIKILDSGFKYAKPSLEILKITDPSEYNYVIILNEFFEGVGNAELMFKTAGNMYDAIMAASQYLALSNMNENFRLVLNEIAKDSSLPKALRDAASECADAYNNASQELLEKISLCEYTKDTAIDIFKTFGTEALSRMIIEAFPNYIILDTVLSGMKFIMDNGFNCGDTSEKYYYLEASVGLENSLRKVIKNTLPDYYRYNLTDQSEYYMYSIDMYETSVLLGFDYASDLLTEFSKGIDVSDEEEEVYLNTVSQLAQMKENKKKNYDLFDDKIDDLFVEYYANYN